MADAQTAQIGDAQRLVGMDMTQRVGASDAVAGGVGQSAGADANEQNENDGASRLDVARDGVPGFPAPQEGLKWP